MAWPLLSMGRMDTRLVALAADPRFIPGVYNYCDLWCAHCPLTSRCLLFAAERLIPGHEQDRLEQRVAAALDVAETMIGASSPAIRGGAALDAAPEHPSEPRGRHPLEFLSRHYATQVHAFLVSHLPDSDEPPPHGSALEVAGWFHLLLTAKISRALSSERAAAKDTPELAADALGSAKVVLIGIDRSIAAWQSIAAEDPDARIGGFVELLEALRTGMELHFPDAREFVRPGLDQTRGLD